MASERSSQALAEEMAAWAREASATLQSGTATRERSQHAESTASAYARAPAALSVGRPPPPQGALSRSHREEDDASSTAGPSGYNQNLSSSGETHCDVRRQASRRGSISKRNQRAIDALLAQDKQEEKDKQAADALLRHEDAIYARDLIGRVQTAATDRRAAAALDHETNSGDPVTAGPASAPAVARGGFARELQEVYTRPASDASDVTIGNNHDDTHSGGYRRSTNSTVSGGRHTPATTAAASAAEDAWVHQLQELRAANDAVEASRRAASSSANAERVAREVQRNLERIRRADTDSLRTATPQTHRAPAQVPNARNPQAVSFSPSVDPVAQEVQRELDRIRRSGADGRCGTASQNATASSSNVVATPTTGAADVFAQGMRDLTLDERRAAIHAHTLSRSGSTPQSSGASSVPSSPTTPNTGLQRVVTAPSTRPPHRPRTPPSPERLALLAELYEMEPRVEPDIPFVRLIGDHDPPSVLAEFVADLDLAYPPPPRWHMDLRFNAHVRINADERSRGRFDVRVVVELEIRDV